jgi:hypothetical protein
MFTAQISSSDSKTQEEAIKLALENGLSIVNITDCLTTLRQHYGITDSESFIISKKDINNSDSTSSKHVKIDIYSSTSKQKLDLSICENNQITVKIPLEADSVIDTDKYKDYKDQGVDIYDSSDPAFNTRCYSYQKDGYDTTVNNRINKIYSNTEIKCSSGCTYKGLDENKYIQCDCPKVSINGEFVSNFLNTTLQTFSSINLDIVKCGGSALNVKFN